MKKFKKEEMTTMVSCTANLSADGYTENFIAKAEGLEAPSTQKIYKPAEVKINSFYPADNSILYAVETNDGIKGLLIDAYDTHTNSHVSEFILEVEDIQKSVHIDDE
jgi:hypothetical protein